MFSRYSEYRSCVLLGPYVARPTRGLFGMVLWYVPADSLKSGF